MLTNKQHSMTNHTLRMAAILALAVAAVLVGTFAPTLARQVAYADSNQIRINQHANYGGSNTLCTGVDCNVLQANIR